MKKDTKEVAVEKEKAMQISFWSSKQNETAPNKVGEYKQITKNMPFTLKIVK